ncbi:hypothetical protein FHX46_000318 [Amycolatopsis viridis]|uniref:Uncharacterized protein n=1 Tax=Amycolatopsis viridis TaxID=185678 RepID=A0ABX0SMM4_9PSEU|nr:hypothetical protein [Amycolatopsis viridis]
MTPGIIDIDGAEAVIRPERHLPHPSRAPGRC